jgi:hypothetical protein
VKENALDRVVTSQASATPVSVTNISCFPPGWNARHRKPAASRTGNKKRSRDSSRSQMWQGRTRSLPAAGIRTVRRVSPLALKT